MKVLTDDLCSLPRAQSADIGETLFSDDHIDVVLRAMTGIEIALQVSRNASEAEENMLG